MGILEVHARGKKISSEVTLKAIARRTPGFSGADLANLLNEAAILTARRYKDAVTMLEINDAIDRVIAGMEGVPLTDSKAKRLIAYHEVGHAIVGTMMPDHDPVQKLTLIPRGNSKGSTWYSPDEEIGLESKAKILANIATSLGGRAAEEVVFGLDEVTDGASQDIQRVTSLARQMVTKFGMSDLGAFALEGQSSPPFLGGDSNSQNEYSEEIASQIDIRVRNIALDSLNKARKIISENRLAVDRIVDLLVEQETISGEEFRDLLAKFSPVYKSTQKIDKMDSLLSKSPR